MTPEGFRYRGQIFPTVNGLFRWFKDHYQDPVPGEFYCTLTVGCGERDTVLGQGSEVSYHLSCLIPAPAFLQHRRSPSPGCPGTHFVGEAGLKLIEIACLWLPEGLD